MRLLKLLFFFLTLTLISTFAFADELDDIEAELNKKAVPPVEAAPPAAKEASAETKVTDFSGLGRLAPFSEIAVLQKRYLPRTGRFELNPSFTTITNDPFFSSTGWGMRLGYNFTEAWGIEGSYMAISTSKRQVTKSLEERTVKTSTLVSPENYSGLDLKWSPSYGKMAYMNSSIVPFDLYFSMGLGTTRTNQDESASTLHLGTGQTFAITKAFAFRWDFSANIYTASALVETSAGSGVYEEKKQNFNNLFLTVGMSWFFPEASYR